MKHFASSNEREKLFKNYGMVNKNRTKKLDKEEPSHTIYPFSIDELKESQLFSKAMNKNETSATKIHTDKGLQKNTQNEQLNQILTETQQETKQKVKQIIVLELFRSFGSIYNLIFESFSFL